jgi:hypothetical protein
MTQPPPPNEGPREAIAYVRQSRAEQRQRVCHPDRQLAQLMAYCDHQGLHLCADIWDKGIAGTRPWLSAREARTCFSSWPRGRWAISLSRAWIDYVRNPRRRSGTYGRFAPEV